MRVQVVDPSAFTPPYDHALCSALARAGAEVELITSPFVYGAVPPPNGYRVSERFYRHARGPAASRRRLATKLVEHVPDMLAYRRYADGAQVVHFQWLAAQPVDRYLLPRRPLVLTAHDLLPREPRPLQIRSQRRLYDAVDAVLAHSEYGRRRLIEGLGIDSAKVRVIPHGAFDYLAALPSSQLPSELERTDVPVVLFFGLLRPYKGIDVLLRAWDSLGVKDEAELWIVGRPRMDVSPLRADAPAGTKWVSRFVSDPELAACFRRADLVVLPYLQTERFDFSGVLATALAFAKPIVLSDVGGFGEVAGAGAARLVPPGDEVALAETLAVLLRDDTERRRLAEGAQAAARGAYSWDRAATLTLSLYGELVG